MELIIISLFFLISVIWVFSLFHLSPSSRFGSVQFSRVWLFATPWTAARQASLSSPTLRAAQTHVHRVGDALQPSHLLSSPSPAFNLAQHQGLFQWVSSSHHVARVLQSKGLSTTPRFKSISSSGLSFLYGPTLSFIHDCWKNHSFD